MPRQAIINQREIAEDGTIQVRIAKQIIESNEVIAQTWHRCVFSPGCDTEGTMMLVDADLTRLGYGHIPEADWNKVRAIIATEQTPGVVATYRDAALRRSAATSAEANPS